MGSQLILPENYDEICNNISDMISTTRKGVFQAVNTAHVMLNWNIGKKLRTEILKNEKAEYGKLVITTLSKNLSQRYGNGYSRAALFRMIQFYDDFNDNEKVVTLSRQLTWSHFIEIIPIEDELKRDFYATICMKENWSVRTLRERKNSMLYERTVISRKPEETIANEIRELREQDKMSVDMFYRDPYMLDFLGLKDTFSEKDLESAILTELEKFILEMGSDFAFMARQKRIVIDNKDYKIDLLFFHRSLKRLVVIELKIGEFKPEYKAQVELYLRWLNKYEKADGEETPIALILCAEKSQETIELLELNQGEIHVGQYLTQMPPKAVLEEKLHLAIENAKIMLEQRNERD
ncbi:MAG TPA: PDDEXK nuclease domain-containing protein [Lactovum miscens]|uniref:PDDEXK nuclease domain-containing protein n=1 Tax=Lactovum miscens TaxID=190387 RepID=UPI002ED8C60B